MTIDQLFETLLETYLAAWERSLGGVPVDKVKGVWAAKLHGFKVSDIKYALNNLPNNPPSIFQFRDLCRAAPRRAVLELARPLPTQDQIEQLGEFSRRMHEALKEMEAADPLEWAYRLQRRHKAGERLKPYLVRSYREALGIRKNTR